MYVLTFQDQVFLGPIIWHPRMFQAVINDDYQRSVTIPLTDPNGRYDVDADIVIRPVTYDPDPTYNQRIERLTGPFYTMTFDKVTAHNTVESLPVDGVKNMLKAKIADARYTKETGGVIASVQGVPVFLITKRGERDIYLQTLQLGASNVAFKFISGTVGEQTVPQSWMTITTTDLQFIVGVVSSHVQACYQWESTISSQIDAATTLSQLDLININP